MKAARVACKHATDAQDVLHGFIEYMLDDVSLFPTDRPISNPVGFFCRGVQLRILSAGRDRAVAARLLRELAHEIETLGPQEVGIDTLRAKQAKADRRRGSKASSINKQEEEASSSVRAGHLFHGQTGDTRWRYQQLRDGRLFDERAVRSLADSMHRTSQRYRHFGVAGFSHVEWGTEEVHA